MWQAVDLSALGAQAAVGVERARAAAREQLAAALGQRPRLALRLELDGPKVAVPVPATDTTGARMRQISCHHLRSGHAQDKQKQRRRLLQVFMQQQCA